MVTQPGDTVVDYLEFYEWSQRDLARRTGISPKTISEICSGKTPITPTTALMFERVFKRPAHFWLNLQRKFDESVARGRMNAKFSEWDEWAKRFPLVEMQKYGWLERKRPKKMDVESLLDFLGVSSPASWQSVWDAQNIAFRQTRRFTTTPEAISAWIRATEIFASELEAEIQLKEFNDTVLLSVIDELKRQTRKRPENFESSIQSLCAQAGVLVVWVPELKHTGVSGCTRWLTDKKVMIALTLRYKTDDQMWFTFFHELGHVLLHRKDKLFILDNAHSDLGDGMIDPPMRAREEEANRFAADTLIPPESLFYFLMQGEFSNEAIHDLADELQIAPGIIVGRLQREGYLKRYEGNALKQQFNWKIGK
jgi:addiction module HigA family antidote